MTQALNHWPQVKDNQVDGGSAFSALYVPVLVIRSMAQLVSQLTLLESYSYLSDGCFNIHMSDLVTLFS